MARARFSIGIDLGTSNSALAFVPLHGDSPSEVLAVPQWDSPSALTESTTLPSFLYLPEDAVAAQIRGAGAAGGEWIVGRLARKKAAETPGRVAACGEVLALSPRGRSLGAVSALGIGRDPAPAQDLARARVRARPRLSARRLERPVRGVRRRLRVRRPGDHRHRPGFVRRRRPASDARRRPGSRISRHRPPARGTAGGILQLAGAARPGPGPVEQAARPRDRGAPRSGGRRRRRHVRFQPVRTRPEPWELRSEDQAGGGERPHPARRRQHRSRHRASAGTPIRQGRRQALGHPVEPPRRPLPRSQGAGAVRRRRAGRGLLGGDSGPRREPGRRLARGATHPRGDRTCAPRGLLPGLRCERPARRGRTPR